MQFSISKFLVFVTFVCVLVAAAFAMPPMWGLFVLSFISLMVLPPFLWVGVFNTRGPVQAFFLGAIITGIPHFVASLCMAMPILMGAASADFDLADLLGIFSTSEEGGEEVIYLNITHFMGIFVGAMGGSIGMFAWWFIKSGSKEDASSKPDSQ